MKKRFSVELSHEKLIRSFYIATNAADNCRFAWMNSDALCKHFCLEKTLTNRENHYIDSLK